MDTAPKNNEVPGQLLKSREIRWQYKKAMINQGFHLISLQLNIPGFPKKSDTFTAFLKSVKARFELFLQSHVIALQWEEQFFEDEAGECIIYKVSEKRIGAAELKELTELFEEKHPLGRIIDADVMDVEGKVISSGKHKRCFLCPDKPVQWCRKYNNHTPDEIRESMQKAIVVFLMDEQIDQAATKMAGFAVSGLLHEVSLSPKPGLVSRTSSGGHTDMDFSTFMSSVGVLAPYYQKVGQMAGRFKSPNLDLALPEIREIGLEMEREMFQVTQGVNTHKGAIFLLEIAMFAAVRSVCKKGKFKTGIFASVIQQLSKGIVQRELYNLKPRDEALTHGQNCFLKYGLQGAGARGEVEQGLPTVLHHALPELISRLDGDELVARDTKMKPILVPVLLKIMSVNNDTNVLYRHGKKVLEELKRKAVEALHEWDRGSDQKYLELDEWCTSNRISSGGSADLLSVTLFVYYCKKAF